MVIVEDERKFWDEEQPKNAEHDQQTQNDEHANQKEQDTNVNEPDMVIDDEIIKQEADDIPKVETTAPLEEENGKLSEFDKLIHEATEMELQHFKTDQEELERYSENLTYWTHRLENVIADLEVAAGDCQSQWQNLSKQIIEQLENLTDSNYVSLINGRLNGIDLVVNKMMVRLLERAKSIAPESIQDSPLMTMTALEWEELVANQQEQALIIKELSRKHKKLGNDRYKVITDVRNSADRSHKKYTTFIEKQVLPIIDGIVDGFKNSLPLKTTIPNGKEYVRCFGMLMQSYHILYNVLMQVLNKSGVYEITVNRGDPIDYERHEPFDMEPDGELSNELIKDAIRSGYEYVYKEGKPNRVLRPAQVVVVKN